MKSVFFELKYPTDAPERMSGKPVVFRIPTLPAYALDYTEFYAPNQLDHGQKRLLEGRDYTIETDMLAWTSFEPPLFTTDNLYRLIVHHHGIRDYKLLFPHVVDELLKERLGCYYRESEIAFKNGAWLSFAVMCGAVYEGLLFSRSHKPNSFSDLLKKARNQKLITSHEYNIMDLARGFRNLVHADRYSTPYVSRLQAMDMKSVMGGLIKKDWHLCDEIKL